MRAVIGILFVSLVALVAGIVGFQAGVMSNIGAGTATATSVVWLWGFPHVFGFLFFFLFLFLFIGPLLFVVGGRRRRWGYGYGPMGYGSMSHGPAADGDPRHQWIADAHRRLHEDDARNAGTTGTPGGAAGTSTGTPGSSTSSTGGGAAGPTGGPTAG